MIVYLFTSLFYLLSFLFICGTLCGQVCANSKTPSFPSEITTVMFKTNEKVCALLPTGNEVPNQQKVEITAESYYFPFILSADDIIIAVAGVNLNDKTNEHINILTNYTELKEKSDEIDRKIINSDWNTQLVLQSGAEPIKDGNKVVKKLLGVATENKIYILLVNCTANTVRSGESTSKHELKLFVGTIDNKKTPEKTIDWKDESSLINDAADLFKNEFHFVKLTDNFSSGLAFVTKEKDIVFLLVAQIEKKQNAALIHLKKSDTEKKSVYKKITEDCFSKFFSWDDKIIMLPTKCGEEENKKIMELNNSEGNWKKHKGPLSRLENFLKDKHNFFEVSINDTRLLLFTEEKTSSDPKKEIYLWMTNGSCVGFVGTITTDFTEKFHWSLLYTKKKLFALYKNYDFKNAVQEKNNIYLTHLNEQEKNITNLLDAWKKGDDKIEQLCKDNTITTLPCLTDRLVGFLSDNKENNNDIWQDWYLNVNATVKNGKQIKDGFSFTTEGAGAIWPVGSPLNSQPYDFADFGFTLLATVRIEKHSKKTDNSILGVKIDDKKVIRLWCTSDGKWKIDTEQVEDSENKVAGEESCEQENVYQLAITYKKNKKFFVYVDGNKLSSINEGVSIQEVKTITHFYFGVDNSKDSSQSTANSHVEVTNVLLYNLPFTSDYCEKLKATKNNKAVNGIQNNGDDNSHDIESEERTTEQLNNTQGENKEPLETSTSSSKIAENTSLQTRESAVSVKISVSFGLLFLLFSVDVCVGF